MKRDLTGGKCYNNIGLILFVISFIFVKSWIDKFSFFSFIGYPSFKGQVLNSGDLGALYEGLKANDLNQYTHLLTGKKDVFSIFYRIVIDSVLKVAFSTVSDFLKIHVDGLQ